MSSSQASGYSLVELAFVTGLVITVSGIAVPQMLVAVDDMRTSGATRYIAARLQQTRSEAVRRSSDVAMRFVMVDGRYTYAVYIDGNRNGVRTHDVRQGVDRLLGVIERLGDSFSGVEFGTLPDLPPVDPGGTAPGMDPIRLGPAGFATFTAMGTSTSGSLYIRGRRAQYVVRIFGATGKTRALRFNARTRQWTPL